MLQNADYILGWKQIGYHSTSFLRFCLAHLIKLWLLYYLSFFTFITCLLYLVLCYTAQNPRYTTLTAFCIFSHFSIFTFSACSKNCNNPLFSLLLNLSVVLKEFMHSPRLVFCLYPQLVFNFLLWNYFSFFSEFTKTEKYQQLS